MVGLLYQRRQGKGTKPSNSVFLRKIKNGYMFQTTENLFLVYLV